MEKNPTPNHLAQSRELLWIVVTIAMMMVVGWLIGIGTGLGLTSALSAQQTQARNVIDIPRRPDKGFRRKLLRALYPFTRKST